MSRTPGSVGVCTLGVAEVEVRGVVPALRRRRPGPGHRGTSKPTPSRHSAGYRRLHGEILLRCRRRRDAAGPGPARRRHSWGAGADAVPPPGRAPRCPWLPRPPSRPPSVRPVATSRPSRSSSTGRDGTAVDDVLLETAPGVMPDSLVSACNTLDGVQVLWMSRYGAGGNLFLDLEAVEALTQSPAPRAATRSSTCCRSPSGPTGACGFAARASWSRCCTARPRRPSPPPATPTGSRPSDPCAWCCPRTGRRPQRARRSPRSRSAATRPPSAGAADHPVVTGDHREEVGVEVVAQERPRHPRLLDVLLGDVVVAGEREGRVGRGP